LNDICRLLNMQDSFDEMGDDEYDMSDTMGDEFYYEP